MNIFKEKVSYRIPGLQTSSVSDDKNETGCTLMYFPNGAVGAVDVRGGSPAAREEGAIGELNISSWVDAIMLCGGSTYGLEAASGVMRKLHQKKQYSTHFDHIPCIPTACVYDFRQRDTYTYPDVAMGEKAFEQLQSSFIEKGRVGGGTHTWVGKVLKDHQAERGGQGAHFVEVDGCGILAVTVTNPLGNVLNFQGEVIAGSLNAQGKRQSIANYDEETQVERGNTTISCLITNAQLSRLELKRLAVMVHTSMGRVIEPFHTPYDGDVLFAVIPNGEHVEVKDFLKFSSKCALAMQTAVISAVQG